MNSLQFVLYGVIFICLWCVFNQYVKDHPKSYISTEGYRNNNHRNNISVPKPPKKPSSNLINKAFGIAHDVSDTVHDTVGTLLKKVRAQLDDNKSTTKTTRK